LCFVGLGFRVSSPLLSDNYDEVGKLEVQVPQQWNYNGTCTHQLGMNNPRLGLLWVVDNLSAFWANSTETWSFFSDWQNKLKGNNNNNNNNVLQFESPGIYIF
jgi:hypothetical protein